MAAERVAVYPDVSPCRFDMVCTAVGKDGNAVAPSPEALYACASARNRVDVRGGREGAP